MPFFLHNRFPRSPNFDLVNNDVPSLKHSHSPSTISFTSQSSTSISLRQRVSSFASKFRFRSLRGRPTSKCGIEHISRVPWPRSRSTSPSPPSPDIRPPSGLGRRASSISDLDILPLDSPSSPRYSLFHETPLPPIIPPLARPESASSTSSSHQARRTRTLSSPALLGSVSETAPSTQQQQRGIPSTATAKAQTYESCSPRHARRQARQNPPIPLSLVLAHVPRSQLPALALISKRFCTAAQLALYHTLALSPTDADACIARLAATPHLAALVTSLTLPAYPPAHGASFQLALALALRPMRALAALTLPAFDADVLAAAPPALVRLTLLADTLPYAFFDRFLPTRPHITHLALPHFVGVPPGAGEVPPAAVPALAALDTSPGLAAALAPGRPLQRVALRVASTLYDGLRPAALFGALGGQLKELVLVLAPDVDARTRGRLLGALAKTGGGLETLELRLEGKSDEVALHVLYKQVGTLLPNVRALRTLRLRAVRTTGTPVETDYPSRLAVWTRPPSGSALRCIEFPSGSRWELDRGEWVRINSNS